MSNLVVQTNVLALNSHRNLKVIGGKQSVASARLSSGYRINSAADDASGLAISEKMRAQIRGLDMASKNTQDGISLVQTAEGGMQEVDNMIQRIRELAVQASNDTNDYTTNDRVKIQDEIEQLTQGIDAMAGQVEFNAKKLLDGSLLDSRTKSQLIGEAAKKIVSLTGVATKLAASDLVAGSGTVNGELGNKWQSNGSIFTGAAITAAANPVTAAAVGIMASSDFASADAVDDYVDLVNNYLAATEANGTATETSRANAQKAIDTARQIYAGLERVDTFKTSNDALEAITDSSSLWFQTGANSNQGIEIGVGSIKSDVLGIGKGNGGSTIDVNNASGVEITTFIDIVDDALQYVTSQRAKLGAVQNRMEYTKSSLDISSENLSASESRIRDADMAKEMMKMTAANVLQQAGVSMLSQANQAPQSVLQLLG